MKQPLTSSMIAEACDDLKRELIDEFRRKKSHCHNLYGSIHFSSDERSTISVEAELFLTNGEKHN